MVDCVINYVIWSDALQCNYCEQEYVFWDTANIDNNISGSFAHIATQTSINHFQIELLLRFGIKHCKKKLKQLSKSQYLENYKKNNKAFIKKPY